MSAGPACVASAPRQRLVPPTAESLCWSLLCWEAQEIDTWWLSGNREQKINCEAVAAIAGHVRFTYGMCGTLKTAFQTKPRAAGYWPVCM